MSKLWKKSTRGTGVSGKIRLVSISKCGLFGMRGGYSFQFKLWQAFHQHSPNANLSKVCHSHKNMSCNKCSRKASFGFVPEGLLWGVFLQILWEHSQQQSYWDKTKASFVRTLVPCAWPYHIFVGMADFR